MSVVSFLLQCHFEDTKIYIYNLLHALLFVPSISRLFSFSCLDAWSIGEWIAAGQF
jgi:hypothetical protein